MTTKFTTSSLDVTETTSLTTTSISTNTSATTEKKSTTMPASIFTLPTVITATTTMKTETETESTSVALATSKAQMTTELTTIEPSKLTTSTVASTVATTTEEDLFCPDQYNKSCYHFAVFPSHWRDNYLISGDGELKRSTNVKYPDNERRYLEEAVFAMFKGDLYIFGGKRNPKKVAVLKSSKCEFEELNYEIPLASGPGSAALSMDNDSKILACFEKSSPSQHSKKCILILESPPNFVNVNSTNYSHYWGRLALWNNQPTTVGGDVDFRKVETFKGGNWTELQAQPQNYFGHSLVGLRDGSLLKLGGIQVDDENRPYDNFPTPEIFKLTIGGSWTQLGDLQKSVSFGSTFYIHQISSIYIFPGKGNPDDNYPIQRVDSGDFKTDIIGYHGTDHLVPVLLHAEHDFCV